MNIIKQRDRQGNGHRGLSRIQNEMESLFERFFDNPWSLSESRRENRLMPRLDMAEDADCVTLRVELPGMKPDDIQIDISGGVLTISGEKCEQSEEKKRNFTYCETEYGSFSRSIQLPSGVDPDAVDARYHDGVLTIELAKRSEARMRKIPIQSGRREQGGSCGHNRQNESSGNQDERSNVP